ncbi:MAG: efflux RND transporter periplasmic adaptor subunit [Gemmataceae bacterium]
MNRFHVGTPRSHAPRGNARWDAPRPVLASALLLLVAAAGCHKAASDQNPIEVAPSVEVVKPERRDLHREVGQPGYVFAYEQTSLFPKVSGFIEEYLVDIGDPVKKGQLLTRIYVPELHASLKEKQATLVLDEKRVVLAEQMVDVAKANIKVAAADVAEARAEVGRYQASVERWTSEVRRLSSVGDVVDKQIREESKKRLAADVASRAAAEAAVTAAQARELAKQVDLEKAKVEVAVARAQIAVAKAAVERLTALVSYTHVTAPYDGVVVIRNANTGDYVEPRFGDESAPLGGVRSDTRDRGTPIYVVARTDLVRIYVDVPEVESHYVDRGTKARVRIQSLEDTEYEGTVTRTSWALNVQSRTLRAEIDMPNKDAKMRPGMYAYGLVQIERHNVRTVPLAAVIEIGNENVVFLHEDGKAKRTPVQTGTNDGEYIEVFRKKVKDKWVEFSGNEEIILGDLPELRDGEKVRVSDHKGPEKKESKPSIHGEEKH